MMEVLALWREDRLEKVCERLDMILTSSLSTTMRDKEFMAYRRLAKAHERLGNLE